MVEVVVVGVRYGDTERRQALCWAVLRLHRYAVVTSAVLVPNCSCLGVGVSA